MSDLAVDRLSSEAGASLEVVLLEDSSFGADTEHGPRTPHRHDYHELIWTRSGAGQHLIDGEVSVVQPGTVTLIGRGPGARLRARERALRRGRALRRRAAARRPGGARGPRLAARRPRRRAPCRCPPSDVPRLESTIASLAAETRRPADACSLDLERHLLSAAAAVGRALVRRVAAPSSGTPTTRRSSSTGGSSTSSSATSPATTTSATTRTSCGSRPPRCRARSRTSPAARPRSTSPTG